MLGKNSVKNEPYRFGFNGMEMDEEFTGSSSHYDFGARIYDSRLGRWMSVDPVVRPQISPYAGMDNSPIIYADPDGKLVWFAPLAAYYAAEVVIVTVSAIIVWKAVEDLPPINFSLPPRDQLVPHTGSAELPSWIYKPGQGKNPQNGSPGMGPMLLMSLSYATKMLIDEMGGGEEGKEALKHKIDEMFADPNSEITLMTTPVNGMPETKSILMIRRSVDKNIIIKQGQTLTSIAKEHGITVEELKNLNGLENDMIYAGEELIVSRTEEILTVEVTDENTSSVTLETSTNSGSDSEQPVANEQTNEQNDAPAVEISKPDGSTGAPSTGDGGINGNAIER